MNRKIIITIIAVLAVLGAVFYAGREQIRMKLKSVNLPEAVPYDGAAKKIGFVNGQAETIDIIPLQADLKLPAVDSQPPAVGIPAEFNLDIPFAAQAPYAVWDALHKDACEETSVIMAAHFVMKKSLPTPAYIESEILKIVGWETKNFGFWKDTDAAKTAEILRNFYNLKDVRVIYDMSMEDVKKEVAAGFPVILPAAGRELHNPYFSGEGPFYHMLVVKGYTKDGKIITNDPGTKRGKDFIYNDDVLFNAIHDWNGGDVMNGRKVMIVVKE